MSNQRKVSTQNPNQRPTLKLPNVEPKLVSYILDEVIENRPHVKFDDIGKPIMKRFFLFYSISVENREIKDRFADIRSCSMPSENDKLELLVIY